MDEGPDTLFYDGQCALCHGAVRFVIARDPEGRIARFAPLAGALFREAISEAHRASLPDSLVVVTKDGRLMVRSAAVLHLQSRIGGFWGVVATVARVFPRILRDLAYDGIARIRYEIFGEKDDACPVIPGPLRARFDLRP